MTFAMIEDTNPIENENKKIKSIQNLYFNQLPVSFTQELFVDKINKPLLRKTKQRFNLSKKMKAMHLSA